MATPTPRTLYVHDDLTEDVRRRAGETSVVFRLTRRLFETLTRDTRVIVLTLEEQIRGLVAQGERAPFAVAVGVGRAGERVAYQIHARTGWFPLVHRVGLTREERATGYALVSTASQPLGRQLAGLDAFSSIAVVDDTVYSGLTLQTLLGALPAAVRSRTRAFCLRAVVETLPRITPLAPITAGFTASGRLDVDVSFINASGLVNRGAIRREGQPALAFYERPEWIRAWFPDHAAEVLDLCARVSDLLRQEE
ncbi:MAG: hypothetical protein ACREJ9_12170 [Candidatus Rokuibacteriota bacterium]